MSGKLVKIPALVITDITIYTENCQDTTHIIHDSYQNRKEEETKRNRPMKSWVFFFYLRVQTICVLKGKVKGEERNTVK